MLSQANSLHIPIRNNAVHTIVTSPPYWAKRDYGLPPTQWPAVQYVPMAGVPAVTVPPLECCLGLEDTLEAFVGHMVLIGREMWRVLHSTGTMWLNLGDSYAGSWGLYKTDNSGWKVRNRQANRAAFSASQPPTASPEHLKPKDLCGVPWRVAFALQADGWWLRSAFHWLKPNAMPESTKDRPHVAHEDMFLFSKSRHYYYDSDGARVLTGREASIAEYQAALGSNAGADANRYEAGYRKRSRALTHPNGRSRRTTDWFSESIDLLIDGLATALREARSLRQDGGLSVNDNGTPLGLELSTRGFRGQHYASYPQELVAPLLLATTSRHGVCPQCGAQYERCTEREFIPQQDVSLERGIKGANGQKSTYSHKWDGYPRGSVTTATTGWQPTCECETAAVQPALVLDPFCGSGTTGAVARELGLRFIGIDKSGNYLREYALPRSEHTNTVASMATLPLFQG